MQLDHFDTDQKVLIIAEIGNNHEGSISLAEELVGRAAEAGADAVKFQTFRTEHYVSSADTVRFDRLRSFEFTYQQFEHLANVARKHGILFLSTPFDLASAEFLGSICPAIKISSGDIEFRPLVECVAKLNKPVLLSTGASDLRRVAYAKATLEAVWANCGGGAELAILHCVSAYPTPPEQANLAAISRLQQAFPCTVGYSDHTEGIQAAAIATALGARVIEKHFTIDKNYSDFRDHQLSADPAELRELVNRVRQTSQLLGDGEKRLQPDEIAVAKAIQRSIVASRELPEGTIISWDDLNWVRCQGGLPPGQEHQLLGRSVKTTLREGTPLDDRLVA